MELFWQVLTNALWDLFKPITRFVFEITLNLSTLGIDKFKDSIYKDIAKGLHEGTSLQLLLFIYATLFAYIFVLIMSFILVRRKLQTFQDKNTKQTVLDRVNESKSNLHQRPLFIWFLVVYTVFSSTIFFLDLTKEKYINQAVTYYGQLINIVDSFITEEQKEIYIYIFFFSN